jgi:hypothetical protein
MTQQLLHNPGEKVNVHDISTILSQTSPPVDLKFGPSADQFTQQCIDWLVENFEMQHPAFALATLTAIILILMTPRHRVLVAPDPRTKKYPPNGDLDQMTSWLKHHL